VSDIGRYRRLYPRLWRHPGFVGLTKSGRELALYLLTGPQTNRLGIFHLSVATASEDLNVAVETIRKGLADVGATFGWTFDAAARVLYIPSWWKWNQPANANVLKGNLKDLNDIPPCGLLDAFAQNLETLDPTFHQTFVEGCRQRIPERPPNQEQYQKHFQKQEQESGASRRGLRTKSPKTPEPTTGISLQATSPLVTLARETLKLTNPNNPIDELVDTCQWLLRQKNGSAARADVVAALNVALAERRAS